MNKNPILNFEPKNIIEDFDSLSRSYLLKNNLYCIPQIADEFHIDQNFIQGLARVIISNPGECFMVLPFWGDSLDAAGEPVCITRSDVEGLEKIFREFFGSAILLVSADQRFVLFTTYNDYRLVAGDVKNLDMYFNGINSGVCEFEKNFSEVLKASEYDKGSAYFLKLLEIAKNQYLLPSEF